MSYSCDMTDDDYMDDITAYDLMRSIALEDAENVMLSDKSRSPVHRSYFNLKVGEAF